MNPGPNPNRLPDRVAKPHKGRPSDDLTCSKCGARFAPDGLDSAGHCKMCALKVRVAELEAVLLECEESLLRSYNAQAYPADGTSDQEVTAAKAKAVRLKQP